VRQGATGGLARIFAVATVMSLGAWSAPALAAVYVGATFDKDITALPDTSTTLTPETLVELGDIRFTGAPGETNLQTQFINLSAVVKGGDFVVDASHLFSYATDASGAVTDFDVVVSFEDWEWLWGGAGAIAHEDLVRITSADGVVTSSLFFDFDEDDLRSNIDLNALHILSETEILVSFDKDVKDYFGPGMDMTKDDVTKFTISGTSTIVAAETFIDLDFGSGANLDAFTIAPDGSILGSFEQTISDPQDGTVQDHDIWRFSTAGLGAAGTTISVTDIGVSLYLDNTGIETNVNLASLFWIDVPEPGLMLLLGLGLALLGASRSQIRNAPPPIGCGTSG